MASLDPLKIPHSPFPMFTGPLSRYFPVCLPLLSVINAVLTFRFEAATGGAAKDICFHDSGLDPDHLVDLTTRMRIDLIYTTDSSELKIFDFSFCHWSVRGSKSRFQITKDYLSYLHFSMSRGENQFSLLLLLFASLYLSLFDINIYLKLMIQ